MFRLALDQWSRVGELRVYPRSWMTLSSNQQAKAKVSFERLE